MKPAIEYELNIVARCKPRQGLCNDIGAHYSRNALIT
jgi:hypothetical protein